MSRESLASVVSDLRSPDEETRAIAAKKLAAIVATQARELNGELFIKFMQELNMNHLLELVNSPQSQEKLGVIAAIEELLNLNLSEYPATWLTPLSNYLHICFASPDVNVVISASKALGHLARTDSTVNEFVEFEMKRAIEWLQNGDRYVFAATLMIKELALNIHSRTSFLSFMDGVIDLIWIGLRNSQISVRETSAEALHASLQLADTKAQYNVDRALPWCNKLFDEVQKGLQRGTLEAVHGSMLVIGELLVSAPTDFINTTYKDIWEILNKYRNSKEKIVRNTVLEVLPLLAKFNADVFSRSYLHPTINHLLGSPTVRGTSISINSLGQIALAVKERIKPYLDEIIKLLKSLLLKKKQVPEGQTAAIRCVGTLSVAYPAGMTHYCNELLKLLFALGLSPALTATLKDIAEALPECKRLLKQQLLNLLAFVLSNNSPKQKAADVILAFQTLRDFKLGNSNLLVSLVSECLVEYLGDENPAIRREAILTCSKLIAPACTREFGKGLGQTTASMVVDNVLYKLLSLAVTDKDAKIRTTVLASLDSKFDCHLAQEHCLNLFFIALHDESFQVRELSLKTLGRIAHINPALVMPTLRLTLNQILAELSHCSDSSLKEEYELMLINLIKIRYEKLIQPNIKAIIGAVLQKFQELPTQIAIYALEALGELAQTIREGLVPYISTVIPKIVDTLMDQSSTAKREAALRTFGMIAENCGYVITPYSDFPKLLNIILSEIKNERTPGIRREAIKLIGILGAIDPDKHKAATSLRTNEGELNTGKKLITDDEDYNVSLASEEYYSTVAISSLMRILKNPSLSNHHNRVIEAVVLIFRSINTKCLPFLPRIMGPFLNTMKNAESEIRGFLFQQLSILISIVKQHIRPYLQEIMLLVREQWQTNILTQIVSVTEELASAGLRVEMREHMSDLVSKMAAVLTEDNSPKQVATKRILLAFSAFGEILGDFLYLVIPAIVVLLERIASSPLSNSQTLSSSSSLANVSALMGLQQEALRTLTLLINRFGAAMYTGRIVHPLLRIIEYSPHARKDVMETLTAIASQSGRSYLVFAPMVNKILAEYRIQHAGYDNAMNKLNHLNLLDMTPVKSDVEASVAVTTYLEPNSVSKLKVNEYTLQKIWAASQQFSKDDWVEWLRKFAIGQLSESSSHALRACQSLATIYQPLLQELFNATFASCYNEQSPESQRNFVKNLKNAMLSPNIPPEILQTLLNLAEFMELCEKPLPISIRTLATLAEKCHAYAKTLRYLESEFTSSATSASIIEALISANDMLQQPEAAIGVIVLLQKASTQTKVELKESWYEKLQRWEDAMAAYEAKQIQTKGTDPAVTVGMIRCLNAMGEWERLENLAKSVWHTLDKASLAHIAPMVANAAFNLGHWDSMGVYLRAINKHYGEGSFYKAIYAIHNGYFDKAERNIAKTLAVISNELGALVGESYSRAYNLIILVQQLTELQEVIEYKQTKDEDRKIQIIEMWEKRLYGCQPNVDIWQRLLAIRSLVLSPAENLGPWLKFVRLCRKNNRMRMANTSIMTLLELSDAIPNTLKSLSSSESLAVSHQPLPFTTLKNCHPQVVYAYLKHLWALQHKKVAFQHLQQFANMRVGDTGLDPPLRSRCYHTAGKWQLALHNDPSILTRESDRSAVLSSFKAATEHNKTWWRAWHSWALANTEVINQMEKKLQAKEGSSKGIEAHESFLTPFLVCAIDGFFKSIALGASPNTQQGLQDILRLLTLWFKYGSLKKVETALHEGFNTVAIDTWLNVIPQLIARIHISVEPIRRLLHKLLAQVGKEHPQALIYPLTVASKSQSTSRIAAAQYLMEKMKQHSPMLVEQALLVSQELIRVAILWREMWKECLDEALRFYMDQNVAAMFNVLTPVFQTLQKGPETPSEESFKQLFASDLERAWEFCQKSKKSGKISQLNKAWDIFFQVLRKIKGLPQFSTLELHHASPKLLEARDLELAIPGTYEVGQPLVQIKSFNPQLSVFHTKQKPRKLTISGSDGFEYVFLLKGHEDLRQDERVMQLFGLVNTLLAKRHETSRSNLSIQRYAVIPLSPNSGLAGWVDSCDTLHNLITTYRNTHKLDCLFEHKKILEGTPKSSDQSYEAMMLIQRVEAFEVGVAQSPGNDLQKILWLKSSNSEQWLYRRTNYTRSLAVMSMVGYILGLGDRHPNNLMLHRHTGKVIHIDFGDCFEVAMHRERYSEKIPFRLTRMLTKAMGVSDVEGLFRITAENVMHVLRDNKESLMAMLEAFVHDPLINWRLLDLTTTETSTKSKPATQTTTTQIVLGESKEDMDFPIVSPQALNQRAISVIDRVERKLTGRDFSAATPMDVPNQVRRLIEEAESSENLCLCYSGWCPFW